MTRLRLSRCAALLLASLLRLRAGLFLICGLLCTPLAGFAAELAWESLAETSFNHLDVDNGLPHGVATSIAQDRAGFIWVGTQGGLARWDGYRFRVFQADARSPTSLPDDLIQVLHLDQKGQLWIGSTSGGLSRYDATLEQFTTLGASAQGLSNPSIYALADDGAGGLWIGTQGGLNHLASDGKTIKRWLHAENDLNSLPDNHVSTLLHTKDGQLWVGTVHGLARMEGERFYLQPLGEGADAQPDIRALWQAPDGKLWIGARQGAYLFDPKSGKVQSLQQLLPNPALAKAMINGIVAADDDEVWLCSANHGIFSVSLKNMRLHRIKHDSGISSSLADDAVQAMFKDRSGLMWVAGLRGLSRHDLHQHGLLNLVGDGKQMGHIGDRDVWSVFVAKDGKVWLGLGANGVDVLHPQLGLVQSLRPDPEQPNTSLPQTQVLALAEMGTQMLIGTNRGLYRHAIGSTKVELLPLPPRNATRGIKTLHVEKDKVWLGSSDGVWFIPTANGEISSASPALLASFSQQLSDQRITSFTKDDKGKFWIGTWNGLNIVDPISGELEQVKADASRNDGLAHGFITTILCDRAGRMWIGTSGGGVHLWLGRNSKGQAIFRRFGLDAGLPNAIINKLLQDAKGNIWASTDGGLARIDNASLTVQAWRRADGVQFSTYWANAGASNPEGELLFGAAGGLTVVQPERLQHWSFRPKIVVTDVRIGGKVIAAGNINYPPSNGLIVPAASNSLAVEFAALDFSAPEKNRYSYQLDGFDPRWLDSEANRRLAAYTNLPPGQYTLRLRGSNRDGLAVEKELVIPVTVLPDWYQTWWFRLLMVASGAAAVLALIHVRTQYLHLQKQVLAREIEARTNEISAQQSTLVDTNFELQRANQELASSAATLRELGQIGREITANLEFETMFEALHLHIRKLLHAPSLTIYIADYGQNELRFSFGREDDTVLSANSIPFDSPTSFSARCAREHQEILVELDEGQINPSPIPNTRNMLTLLFGPLIVDQHLLGVMSIQSDKVRAYGERERMIFRTLSAYAAIALENGAAYRQLQEAQDMLVAQEKLAALGALVAGVSHELNTPLGNGIMMASSLQDNIDALLDKLRGNRLHRNELEDYLQDAQEAAQVLMRNLRNSAQLVNSFKQVAVDRTSVQRRVFDLRLTSLEVLATLINQVKSQGLEIECEIAPDIVLDSYPGPYGQVLANLINNALMHAFEGCSGGKMLLKAQRKEAGRIQITFCDDGVGIAECDLKHIFDPFFTTKMGQGGKGLGLSVCYNIVTSILGGQIRVTSNRAHGDAGTCFTLDLPLVAQA